MVPLTEFPLLRVARPRPRVVRYAWAVVIAAVATLLRLALDPIVHDQIPYTVGVAAVVVATWCCGVDGGVLATVVAAFTTNYFFVEPRHQFFPHPADIAAMSLFSVVALGMVWLVSRWKRAETELHQRAERLRTMRDDAARANRLKDEFLATLSHEMRTPLNAILGWAHLLLGGDLDASATRRAVETIVRNAEAQTRLVEDVLDVSRIVNGKLRLNVVQVDVNSLIDTTTDGIRPAAEAKQITLTVSHRRRATVNGDPDRLRQIVWNLLTNAVKFTGSGGQIAVSVDARGATIEIRVADTGMGIAPAFLPFLFEHFSQQDGSTTREHGGLGLGLAIVRHLVELHGGTVHAESAGENRGAIFVVALPARPAATRADRVAGAHAIGVPRPLDGIRVLVADDEWDAREMVAMALTRDGAAVRTAASTREALGLLREWRPDVMLADIGMPGEDGYSLVRQLRLLSPDQGGLTPAVALTAYGSADDRRRALASGYDLHIAKPATPAQVAAAVASLTMPKSA